MLAVEVRLDSFQIQDKNVVVRIIYGQTEYDEELGYRPQDFVRDMNLFRSHHLKEPVKEETYLDAETGKYEKEYVVYRRLTSLFEGNAPMPTWHDFIEISSKLLFATIRQALADVPFAITASPFNLQIHMVRPPRAEYRDWYGDYKQDLSTADDAYVYFNGLWVVERMVAPFFYLKRYDYPTVYKYFVHELGQHHVENVKGVFKFEEKVKARLEKLGEKLENPALTFLYASLFEMLSEGGGEFLDKQYVTRVDFNKSWMAEFKKNMDALSKITQPRRAEAFYDESLSFSNLHGNYYVGRLMFFTIGLGVLKFENRQLPGVMLGEGVRLPLEKLNGLMDTSDVVYVESYPVEHIMRTKSYVDKHTKGRNYRVFIRMYDWACDLLGIADRNRAITYALFERWKKQMTQYYKEHKRVRVLRAGFIPDKV